MSRSVLVIGSTGIFAPAAAALRARGDHVIGVSLHGAGDSIGVDARDRGSLTAALEGHTWDDALVYGPAVSVQSLGFVRGATPGRCVHVRTTGAADPALGVLTVPDDTLQLGWKDAGAYRWHTPAEVSSAALDVLADGRARTLGLVRPWEGRP